MPTYARPMPPLFVLVLLAAVTAASAQPTLAPVSAPTPSAQPVVTTPGATNCPKPPGGTVNYSNCTDPDGPGQGELHLKAVLKHLQPDLLLLPELSLGTRSGQWGDRLQIPVVAPANGICQLSLRLGVINGGQRNSGAARHVVRQLPMLQREGDSGRIVGELQQPPLAPGEHRIFEVPARLSGGLSWLEVRLDVDDAVNESIEANNVRRVQIELDPACS